jgi:hypothetical protein
MRKVERAEIKDLVAYEKAREAMRAHVIEVKKHRRVAVGPNLTVLFENRATVLFQIQEMVRTERMVDDGRIQEEVDVYNALVPDHGELSATLFIEIPELVRMSPDKVRETVNRFQGLDRDSVWLQVDGLRVPARFESGHSKEEKMAAVHYVRFACPRRRGPPSARPRRTSAWSWSIRTTARRRPWPRRRGAPCAKTCRTEPSDSGRAGIIERHDSADRTSLTQSSRSLALVASMVRRLFDRFKESVLSVQEYVLLSARGLAAIFTSPRYPARSWPRWTPWAWARSPSSSSPACSRGWS